MDVINAIKYRLFLKYMHIAFQFFMMYSELKSWGNDGVTDVEKKNVHHVEI